MVILTFMHSNCKVKMTLGTLQEVLLKMDRSKDPKMTLRLVGEDFLGTMYLVQKVRYLGQIERAPETKSEFIYEPGVGGLSPLGSSPLSVGVFSGGLVSSSFKSFFGSSVS